MYTFKRLKKNNELVRHQCQNEPMCVHICTYYIRVCVCTCISVYVCIAAADGSLSYNDTVRAERAISTLLKDLASLFN